MLFGLGRFSQNDFYCTATSCTAKGAARAAFEALQTLVMEIYGTRGTIDGKLTPEIVGAIAKLADQHPGEFAVISPTTKHGYDLVFVAEHAQELAAVLQRIRDAALVSGAEDSFRRMHAEAAAQGIPGAKPAIPAPPTLPSPPRPSVPSPIDDQTIPVGPSVTIGPAPSVPPSLPTITPAPAPTIAPVANKLLTYVVEHKQRLIFGAAITGLAGLAGVIGVFAFKRKRRAP